MMGSPPSRLLEIPQRMDTSLYGLRTALPEPKQCAELSSTGASWDEYYVDLHV
jgi:hypothetical protein